MASLLAVAGMAIILLTLITSLAIVQASGKSISGQLRYQGQALNAATAGTTNALAWLQTRPVQPVTAFTPRRDLGANETEDPAIGIVRTYPISASSNLWGRYEVRKTSMLDVSAQRGRSGAGVVWQFDSVGMVFLDRNGNRALDWTDTDGNGLFDWGESGEVLAMRKVRGEAQRLGLVLPAGNAAIQGYACSRIDLSSGGSRNRVLGSNAGTAIACRSGTGFPSLGGAALTGNPAIQPSVSPYDDTLGAVFGVNRNELIGLAAVKAPSVSSLPDPLPALSLVVIQGDAIFTPARPLVGSGVLVVFGDLVIPNDSSSSYSGVIYVTGSYSQGGPSLVSGAVVAHGDIVLRGGGDVAEVVWDAAMVQQVRNALGGYRFSRTEYLLP